MASGLDAQRLRQQLEQVDRGAVGDEHLAGLSADHFGDLVPDARRSLDPVGVVPTRDEPAAPFLADHLGYAWEGLARQGAERVAIEIDHAFREANSPRSAASGSCRSKDRQVSRSTQRLSRLGEV